MSDSKHRLAWTYRQSQHGGPFLGEHLSRCTLKNVQQLTIQEKSFGGYTESNVRDRRVVETALGSVPTVCIRPSYLPVRGNACDRKRTPLNRPYAQHTDLIHRQEQVFMSSMKRNHSLLTKHYIVYSMLKCKRFTMKHGGHKNEHGK